MRNEVGMKNFIHTFAGIMFFALLTLASAMTLAYLTKSFLQLSVEGRYLFLFFTYLNASLFNWLITGKKLPSAKNIVVFGGMLVVGFIAFIELTIFKRSASVYQLYYSVGILPLMYVLANFRLKRDQQSVASIRPS